MASIDPRLRTLLDEAVAGVPKPIQVTVLVKFTGATDDLRAAGLVTGTVVRNAAQGFSIATGTLSLVEVQALAAVPHVVKIELSQAMHSELDTSAVDIRARELHGRNPPLAGKGVTIGVVDFGFDYQHRSFRNGDNKTRVKFLWDQTLTPIAGEKAPPEYPAVGVEYDEKQINDALALDKPLTKVRMTEKAGQDAHGTHVLGIAAGDGSQAGNCAGANTYVGVAPDAELIFVKLRSNNLRIGETANLIDAIAWILLRARKDDPNRPCVVNLSMGDNLGPHDGTNLVEQAMETMLAGTTGFAIVKSAGNEGANMRHAFASIAAAPGFVDVDFTVKARDSTTRYIECWYAGAQRLDVTLLAPGTPRPASPVATAGGPAVSWTLNAGAPGAQQVSVNITQTLNDPDNNDNQVFLQLNPPGVGNLPNGTWTLRFTNTGATPTDVHCWIDRGADTPLFTTHATRTHTLTIPGTAPSVITVGNYADEKFTAPDGRVTESGDLAASSSRGPTRNGLRKPEVSAPGVNILSAKGLATGGCCCDCCYDFYQGLSGTSMSAPHVAGVVALMLQAKPAMGIAEIRQTLMDTARAPDPAFGAVPDDNWGFGKVDAAAAVAVLLAGQPVPPGGGGGGGGAGGAAAGGAGGGPGVPLPRPLAPHRGHEQALLRQMQRFQAWLLSMPGGHEAAALVSQHVDEVQHLVNTHRRVATVWQRNRGPLLVRAALAISADPEDAVVPRELGGLDTQACLANILDRVRRHASAALVADIDAQRATLLALPGRRLADVLGLARRVA